MIKRLLILFCLFLSGIPQAIAATLTSYETGNDAVYELGCGGSGCASQERRAAQSFQLGAAATVDSLQLYLSRGADGGATGVSVRIETNSGSTPSGTLAHANATCTMNHADINTNASIEFETCTFASSFSLNASTTYWIVAKMTTPTTDRNYYWAYDGSSPSYANGNGATSIIGSGSQPSWTAQSGHDALFKVMGTSASRRRVMVVS